jgi:hypothetical protein
MRYRTRTIEAVVTKCDLCGCEMEDTAPLGQYWHWLSDGPGGLFALCAGCANNWRYLHR